MRDIGFIAFLATIFLLGFRRPFLFVLVYVYIDVVSPQRMSYFLLNAFPISAMAVGFAVLTWLAFDDKKDMRVAPRQGLMLALLAWCWWTTRNADFPLEALDKWDWVWKALAFAIFLPLTLRTKLRIEGLLLFMLLSVATIIIVGGVKTVLSGGGYGELNLLVSNNSGLFEGSIISAVSICIIPLILWFTRHGTIFPPDWRVKLFCYALIFACLLMPVGTQARTGLLCVGLLAVLMLRDVKRRMAYIATASLLALVAIPFLPSSFTERMGTIRTYKSDASASTRIEVWKWTWNYVKDNPMGGGFEAYRQNRIKYDTVDTVGDSNNLTIVRTPEIDKARAYHSAYFEMLGEQGWPGFALWLMIHLSGIVRMEVLRRRYMKAPPDKAWIAPLATALQHAHMIYLLGATFVGIALNPFVYMLVGAQIGLDTYVGRKRAEEGLKPMQKKRTAPAVAV
ncbi:putative O-glycosylation ligase, exosortase A system-associated [Sphingomonas sp.]|uniref:putative O-glycosylation ligase, exosortase A system-associated n=1 Tax=Sphingomonas sp. TaxID=28214 RepID=UPI001EB17088|nr:putative O-glycosylation ligase, exosortase A system-associated [Sphingomonas sp.]MBX3592984.1 putative O-glycosylation ligase, exosortase A system-associated [Sphingomonas sp.]